MSGKPPTARELIDVLRNSWLPTIVVEGDTDMWVYRRLELAIGPTRASILVCHGRSTLLELFAHRSEFSDLRCAFVADRDIWLFTGIPDDYSGIIWSKGYSIENDIYSHSGVERLLDQEEQVDHRGLTKSICRWFAFEIEEALSGQESRPGEHISRVVPIGSTQICPRFIAWRGFREPNDAVFRKILTDYQQYLRGKQLFQMLVRYLSVAGRKASYSTQALYEICLTTPNHPNVGRLLPKFRPNWRTRVRGRA